jgi:hypothetical protein
VRPHAVVACRSPADVAETIAFARGAGLHVAVRSGGHCFAGRSSTYPNFPDLDLEDLSPAYYGNNHGRLLRVKARYDPEGFFSFHR